jgi:hypothetical protein
VSFNHTAMQLALRAYAKTLLVSTTGAIQLSATATGYARAAGSFVADGFAVGMELSASGFTNPANNGAKMCTGVSPLAITCAGCVAEVAGARTLTVGLPTDIQKQNIKYVPTPGKTYVVEQYIPGPSTQKTLGPLGELELTPMYSLQMNVPAETGELAANRYIDALQTLFTPRTVITLPSGEVLRVRTDTGPYPSQLMPGLPGFAVQTLTVPFWSRTPNSL